MGVVAVHAAVRKQAHHMQGSAVFLHAVHGPDQGLFFKEHAVLNVLGDAGQFLIHDAARAHVQVAHLAVAHLSVRQAHVHAAGAQLGVGILGHQGVQMGRARHINRVALVRRIDAETVHDNQSRHRLAHISISFAFDPFSRPVHALSIINIIRHSFKSFPGETRKKAVEMAIFR